MRTLTQGVAPYDALVLFGGATGDSTNASRMTVRVIHTDEELMLARSVLPFCSRSVR